MRKLVMNRPRVGEIPVVMFLTEKDTADICKMMHIPGKIKPHEPCSLMDYKFVTQISREVEIMLNNPELRAMQQQIVDLQRELDFRIDCEIEELGDSIYTDFADYINNKEHEHE